MMAISQNDPTKLTMVGSPVDVPGEFPNTVAASAKNNLACVATTGAVAGISCAPFTADGGLGAMDTIRRSIDLTRGRFWGISVVYLLLFLINIGGLLMLGIGLLFTAPLSAVTLATMYALLAGEPTAAEKPAPEFLA